MALGWKPGTLFSCHVRHTCLVPVVLCPAQISHNPHIHLGANLVGNSLSLEPFSVLHDIRVLCIALKVSKNATSTPVLAWISASSLSFPNGPGQLPIFPLCMNPRVIV